MCSRLFSGFQRLLFLFETLHVNIFKVKYLVERWRLGLFLKKQHVCLVHHGDDGTLGDENVQV